MWSVSFWRSWGLNPWVEAAAWSSSLCGRWEMGHLDGLFSFARMGWWWRSRWRWRRWRWRWWWRWWWWWWWWWWSKPLSVSFIQGWLRQQAGKVSAPVPWLHPWLTWQTSLEDLNGFELLAGELVNPSNLQKCSVRAGFWYPCSCQSLSPYFIDAGGKDGSRQRLGADWTWISGENCYCDNLMPFWWY